MKYKFITLILSILSSFSLSVSIVDLNGMTDIEEVLFKSQKEWLIVFYAPWDKNKEIWEDLWNYLKMDFEKDERDIVLGRVNIVNQETQVPDMNLISKYF